jgi:hypothetical protein
MMRRSDERRKTGPDYSLKGTTAVTVAVTAVAMFNTTDNSKAYRNGPNILSVALFRRPDLVFRNLAFFHFIRNEVKLLP